MEAQYGRYIGGQRSMIIVDLGTAPTGMVVAGWKKLDQKKKNTI
jgi:hypothetical protein